MTLVAPSGVGSDATSSAPPLASGAPPLSLSGVVPLAASGVTVLPPLPPPEPLLPPAFDPPVDSDPGSPEVPPSSPGEPPAGALVPAQAAVTEARNRTWIGLATKRRSPIKTYSFRAAAIGSCRQEWCPCLDAR